ncbi:MAG TPA: hypothetical protein VN733_05995 [Solirubrobacterales bacterium]|nr:hypothetical protein [Solirubrobacterales bacterium]
MTADACRWSCARCKVSVGRIDGEPSTLPPSWSEADGEAFCLTCSRTRAGEAAMDLAPAALPREDRVRLRRTALIEFEIGRAPEASNRVVALACRTSGATVAIVRDEMERSTAAASDLDARNVV